MNEETPNNLTPAELEALEQEERYQEYLRDNPVVEVPIEKRDCETDVKLLETLMNVFEVSYPLDQLLNIVDLTYEQSLVHPIRKPAVDALKPLANRITKLGKETNIDGERHKTLIRHFKKLSNAVGLMVNYKYIRHDLDLS